MRFSCLIYVAVFSIVMFSSTSILRADDGSKGLLPDKKIIAKVGPRNITYNEIRDHGDDEYARNREIKALNRIIRDEVIKQEIKEKNIKPTENEIQEKAKEIILRNWELIGKNDEERQMMFEELRQITLKLSKALAIWKKDKKKGDEYAKDELLPLMSKSSWKISNSSWDWAKTQSDSPEFIKRLRVWEETADIPSSD